MMYYLIHRFILCLIVGGSVNTRDLQEQKTTSGSQNKTAQAHQNNSVHDWTEIMSCFCLPNFCNKERPLGVKYSYIYIFKYQGEFLTVIRHQEIFNESLERHSNPFHSPFCTVVIIACDYKEKKCQLKSWCLF